MRPIWTGAVSFGLVHIPVKLYAATEDRGIKLRQLHRVCGTPIRYRKHCPTCNLDLGADDVVSGFEYARGRFVLVEDADLEHLPVPTSRVVEIVHFVDLGAIDPIFYERTYFLEAAEGGAKPYALLRQAMLDTGKVAVARVTLRQRETLAAVRVYGDLALTMATMHWPDEIRSPEGLVGVAEPPPIADAERELASVLIAHLTRPFEPRNYRDRTREALQAVIAAKVEGRRIVEPPRPEPAPVADLMAALLASVRAAEQAGATPGESPGGAPPGGPH